jgi:RNA polymerase sigma-70 factor (ECF subfamily)
MQAVLRALAALPDEQRQVLLLIGVEGFGYEEAAKMLNVPVGTVMSRLSRGRDRLRDMTEGRQGADLRRVV